MRRLRSAFTSMLLLHSGVLRAGMPCERATPVLVATPTPLDSGA